MVNVKQYLAGVAIAAGTLFSSVNAEGYEIKLVKEKTIYHDLAGGGCFYGLGIRKLEYMIALDNSDTIKLNPVQARGRTRFIDQLAKDLQQRIWEDRSCKPTIKEIAEELKKQNQILTAFVPEGTKLTYQVNVALGRGANCFL